MTLMVIQGHSVIGKLDLEQSFCFLKHLECVCEMVDYVREMNEEVL